MGIFDIKTLYLNLSIPFLWGLSIALIIAFFFVPWRMVAQEFSPIKKRTWIFLCLILLGAGVLRFLFVPTMHLFYIDEHLYMDSAKNIIDRDENVNCRWEWQELCIPIVQKAPGWPFILSLMFRAFGETQAIAFLTTKILALLTIIISFLFCFLVFRNESIGLWSSALLAGASIHLQWSNTVESAIPSLLLVMLTLLACAVFLRVKSISLAAITIIFLCFSIFLRYEHVLLLPIGLLLFFLGTSALPRHQKKALHLLAPTVFLIFCIFCIIMVAVGSDFFRPNTKTFIVPLYFFQVFFFIKTISMQFLLVVSLLIGAVLIWKRRIQASFTLLPFLMYSLIYLPFSEETRMLVIPFFLATVLAAVGIEEALEKFALSRDRKMVARSFIFFLIAMTALLSPYPLDGHIRNNLPLYSLETSSTRALHTYVPKECLIISENPSIIGGSTDSAGIRTNLALGIVPSMMEMVLKGECIYYFEDMYCSLEEGNFGDDCRIMGSRYPLSQVANFSNDFHSFHLYRISSDQGTSKD